jgi:predicted nuclease of predicted toxin-antitoxin system
MARMPQLMDECVRKAICDVFAGRGHEIHYVAQELGQKTPDPLVAAAADENRLILVTVNYVHFKKLIARRPPHNRQQFRWAGLISFENAKTRGQKVELLRQSHQLSSNMNKVYNARTGAL